MLNFSNKFHLFNFMTLLSLHPNKIFERCRLSYNNNFNSSVIGILPSKEKKAQREDIQLMLISNYQATENFTPYYSDVKEAVKHRKARPQTLYVIIADGAALEEGTIISYPAYCRGRRRLSPLDQYREAIRIMNMPSLPSHSKIPGEC